MLYRSNDVPGPHEAVRDWRKKRYSPEFSTYASA